MKLILPNIAAIAPIFDIETKKKNNARCWTPTQTLWIETFYLANKVMFILINKNEKAYTEMQENQLGEV